jgi:diguanylate cyclase (GGDEF)-like protein
LDLSKCECKDKLLSQLSELVEDCKKENSDLIYSDEVTGLFNVRFLKRVLNGIVKKAEDLQQPFSVIFIDLDDFKQINDLYGHDAGTQILTDFAGYLKSSVRDSDMVFRYGGDEFLIVAQGADVEVAQRVVQRIEHSLLKMRTPMRISAGIAQYPVDSRDPSHLIRIADERMYLQKNQETSVTA